MATHYPSHVRFAVPALVALTLVACARSSLQTDGQALAVPDDASSGDTDGGLPTKPMDAGVGTKDDDSGLGTKDAGLPTKDSGLGTQDSGSAGDDSGSTGDDDSGSVAEDSGVGANDGGSGGDSGGMTGTPDAGGGVDPCMACAEQRCPIQTNLCLGAPACVAQGECDSACLSAPARGFGAFAAQNRCFQSCAKNLQANIELTVAVSCALTLCPQECVTELAALGQ